MQFRENLLWPASIIIGLLLHTVLASVLWKICTTFEEMQTPTLRLLSIAPVKVKTEEIKEHIEEQTETRIEEPKPAIERPIIEIESNATKAKPQKRPEPVVNKLVKPLTEAVTPEKKAIKPKPRPIKKITKPDTQHKQRIPPVPVTTIEPTIVTQTRQHLPPPALPQPETEKTVATTKTTPANIGTRSSTAIQKDFSSYLRKVYRQLEKNKKYPNNARRRGITGKVAIAFSINDAGKATGAAVIGKSPRELAEAALKLVTTQKFAKPPEDWNNASRVEMQINYSLK